MKHKTERCLYCDKKLEPKTTRQKFCSDKCRVYWNRDNPKVQTTDLNKPTSDLKPPEPPKTNYTINTIPEPKVTFFDTPESFMDKLQNATTLQELENIGKAIDKSSFGWGVKNRLQSIGRQIYNEKFKD